QYADFARWQRTWLAGDILARELAYWKATLDGAAVLQLPIDHPRAAVDAHRGATHAFMLSPELARRVAELGRSQNATLFMTLASASPALLSRYAGQTDISLGTPIANRTQAETEALIGMFVNTLVLRADLSGEPSFRELASRMRETALGAYAHQDVPFERLVEE